MDATAARQSSVIDARRQGPRWASDETPRVIIDQATVAQAST